MGKTTHGDALRRGFSFLELQVAFVLLGIALAGLVPLVVMQSKQLLAIESRLSCEETHYFAPTDSAWARKLGYPLEISYGSCEEEGNIAWGLKADLDKGVITGENAGLSLQELNEKFCYSEEQLQLIAFLRQMEKSTRHKVQPLPGLSRQQLREEGLVD